MAQPLFHLVVLLRRRRNNFGQLRRRFLQLLKQRTFETATAAQASLMRDIAMGVRYSMNKLLFMAG
jgi:hypothetical protein